MPRDRSVLAPHRLILALWSALCLGSGATGPGCSPGKADAPQTPGRLKAMQKNGRPVISNQDKRPAPSKSFPR